MKIRSVWSPVWLNAQFQQLTKAHTREFPVFSVSTAFRGPSGCIILHILSTVKHGVLVFHAVLWWSVRPRVRQEGAVPLSQHYFSKLCRNSKCLSIPTGCQLSTRRQESAAALKLTGNSVSHSVPLQQSDFHIPAPTPQMHSVQTAQCHVVT